MVRPKISDSFWVNLIGKGYPIPSSRNRWCTDRLKIRPINQYISSKVAQFGEVVIVLGVRRTESSVRAQVIKVRSIKRSPLKRHVFFPGAFVYAPIVDFSVEDVWKYLLEVQCPWANESSNQALFDLYKDAGAEERPLVIDNTTPPLGNRRFGCWVCTVVSKDHTMEALVESKGKWMKPLLDFRNFLAELQDPVLKAKYRDHRRRDGKVYFKPDGKQVAWGQTTLEKGLPQILLRKLLETELSVQGNVPDIRLISEEELHEIRRLWRTEQHDWEDQVPAIYHEVTRRHLEWVQDDTGVFTTRERVILERLCAKENLPFKLVAELLDLERQFHGMSKRTNIYNRIDGILKKEWRTLEEIIT